MLLKNRQKGHFRLALTG